MSKKKISLLITLFVTILILGACRPSNRASHNVSREADNFNVVRRVAVINMRSDEIVFEVIGNISIDTSDSNRLVLVAEAEEGVFKKHFINMTEWNMYVVEDLHGVEVSSYRYEVNYIPEMIVPIEVIGDD